MFHISALLFAWLEFSGAAGRTRRPPPGLPRLPPSAPASRGCFTGLVAALRTRDEPPRRPGPRGRLRRGREARAYPAPPTHTQPSGCTVRLVALAVAILTVAILTMAILTVAILIVAILTVAMALSHAGWPVALAMTLALIMFVWGMYKYGMRIYRRFALTGDGFITGKFEIGDDDTVRRRCT